MVIYLVLSRVLIKSINGCLEINGYLVLSQLGSDHASQRLSGSDCMSQINGYLVLSQVLIKSTLVWF